MKQIEDMTHEVGALQIERNELQQALNASQHKCAELEASLEVSEKKVIVARALANHNRRHRAALAKELAAAVSTISQLQGDVAKLVDRVAVERQGKDDAQAALATTERVLRTTQQQLGTQTTANGKGVTCRCLRARSWILTWFWG